MIKLQLKLSGETLALFDVYAEKILDDSIEKQGFISKSYLFQRALNNIQLAKLDWIKVKDYKIEKLEITSKGMQTALMLEEESRKKIERLRKEFQKIFNTQRIYRPFVIKLIIKAAILDLEGNANKVMILDESISVKIIQQNLNLKNQNIAPIIEIIDKEDPEIIFFQEYDQSLHKEIKKLKEKYDFYYPKKYEVKDSNYMLCLLVVKKGIKFGQRNREGISCNLRYIEGKVVINNFELELFLTHIPQASKDENKSIKYNQDRVEYKGESLFGAYRFSEEYKIRNTFIGGDFNVDIRRDKKGEYKKNTRFQAILEAIFDNDFYDTAGDNPTWGKFKFDYALVSKSLYKSNSKSKSKDTTSDHKMIITEINLK